MTWAWLSPLQEARLRDQFESLLKFELEQNKVPLTTEARDALSRLQGRMGIRMVCHKARIYLERTKCRDLNQTFIALDRE